MTTEKPETVAEVLADAPIDAMDNANYIEHCAEQLKRLGLTITGRALEFIAAEYRALASQGGVDVPMPVMEILHAQVLTPLCTHHVMGYTMAQLTSYADARVATAVAALIAENERLIQRHAATERDACMQAERANEFESRLATMIAERDAAVRRADAADLNAARYLWLRNESINYPYGETVPSPWCVYGPDSAAYPSRPIDREELDAAVDKARKDSDHA